MTRTRIPAQDGEILVVKTRLLPTPAQEQLLRSYSGTTRAVHNILLHDLRANLAQRAAEKTYDLLAEAMTPAIPWSAYGLEKYLREHRDTLVPWWDQVPALVLTKAAHHFAAALGNWKTGKARFPTVWKRRGPETGWVPFTLRDKATVWLKDDGRHVHLPLSLSTYRMLGVDAAEQLSAVRTVKDRRLSRAARLLRTGRGQVQELTYSHAGGYWWATTRLRVLPAALPQPQRHRGARTDVVVGVDAGMGARFATLSTVFAGITDETGAIPAPRHLRAAQAHLGDAQRWLSRTQNDSKRRAKAVARVQRLHGRVAARREGFHRQLAIALVEAHPGIGVEDLNLKGMARRTRGWRFSKAIADNGWAAFVTTLEHQGRKRDSLVVQADRFYPSSKTCSGCGAVRTKLSLSEREYACITCGLVLDRDVNAARNLAAIARHALDTREHEHDGVSDAGEASSAQTPRRSGAAAFQATGLVERRVPDPDLALAG